MACRPPLLDVVVPPVPPGRGGRRFMPTTEVEAQLWARGLVQVAGLDEVGRGCWAGPVCAAAVILPPDPAALIALAGVRDSKQLTPRQRAALVPRIGGIALSVGVGRAESAEIDALGIVPATRLAMCRALTAGSLRAQALIVDALSLPEVMLPQVVFPYADARALSVAAASIVAKVYRDTWMAEVAESKYPGYGFARHKGYGTAEHRAALKQAGPCPLHRRTFRPVAALCPTE